MRHSKQERSMSLEEAMAEVWDQVDRAGTKRIGDIIKALAMSRLE